MENLEAFYGGAAGGGKSDGLLMGALQYVDVSGYSALLLRRTYADLALPGALMFRSHEWLDESDAKWKDVDKTWVFPSGATVSFGYLDGANDHFRYQSAEFQYIAFDELTQFGDFQYRYLISRLRRLKGSEIPIRMRAASNPGGIGHEWVKQRFITEGISASRPWIPANLDDNPHLDRDLYVQSLEKLDPVTRAQLLKGDWSVRAEGGKFRREWMEIVERPPEGCRWVRYWDMAAAAVKGNNDPDWTVGVLIGRDSDNIYYLKDIRRFRESPQVTEALIKNTAQLDGKSTNVYMEQEPGAAGIHLIDYYRRKVLEGYAFYGDRPTGDKVVRSNPVSSQAEAGNLKLVRGEWILTFLDEVEIFPNGAHDDQVDAMSGAMQILMSCKDEARITWI